MLRIDGTPGPALRSLYGRGLLLLREHLVKDSENRRLFSFVPDDPDVVIACVHAVVGEHTTYVIEIMALRHLHREIPIVKRQSLGGRQASLPRLTTRNHGRSAD